MCRNGKGKLLDGRILGNAKRRNGKPQRNRNIHSWLSKKSIQKGKNVKTSKKENF